jgi:hypothetical protein
MTNRAPREEFNPAKPRGGLLMAHFSCTSFAKRLGAGGLSLLPSTVTRSGEWMRD